MKTCVFGEGMGLFYELTYDADKFRVIEDKAFKFDEENFIASYKLNSQYYISHRILLIPESKSVPIDYEFKGEMDIEIYDKDDQLMLSYKSNNSKKILKSDGDPFVGTFLEYNDVGRLNETAVFAFELGDIPFELIKLKWERLKNMKIIVTVIKPDLELKRYCENATLVVIPNLRK